MSGDYIAFAHDPRLHGRLLRAASVLDQYYVTARYPNVLPAGAPFEAFHSSQAAEAIAYAAASVRKANALEQAGAPMTTQARGWSPFVAFGPPKYARSTLIQRLTRSLRGRVREAHLVGSYARQEAHSGSDVDLILVVPSSRPFLQRFRDFEDVLDAFCPVDLVVYTPEEFARERRGRGSFAHQALRGSVQLL